MVADSLVYHPTVAHYIRFVSSTAGRDKALRTLQYLARFLSFYLLRKGYKMDAIAPFEAIKKQFASTRKVMRIGKNIEHFKAASQAMDNKSLDPVLRYCAVGRQLGYFTYLTFDALSFLDSSGIYKFAAGKKLAAEAYRAWFVGLIFSLVGGGYTLYTLRERERGIVKTIAEGKVEGEKLVKEREATVIQIVSDVCDVTIPASALGYVTLDDGIVGMAGTVSSLIGLQAIWKKTA
ncbi:peroxisomal biogenesis factor 11 [Morchella snyderi]|nr:peroxisomal biogenesis factor 11 [Morchella snyderi]